MEWQSEAPLPGAISFNAKPHPLSITMLQSEIALTATVQIGFALILFARIGTVQVPVATTVIGAAPETQLQSV